MMRRMLVLCGLGLVIVGLLCAPRAFAQGDNTPTPPGITIIPATAAPSATLTPTPDPSVIPQYGKFEIALPVTGSYTDPSDPTQIEVNVTFTGPGNTQVVVPAYWTQPQEGGCGNPDCTVESVGPAGEAGWRVRFRPNLAGAWSYAALAKDKDGSRDVSQGQFTVTPAQRPGFIHIAEDKRYFAYDNGTTYFPMGMNLGWSWGGTRNTQGYLEWLTRLAAEGVNYARLYVDVPWFIGFNWRTPITDVSGLQADAWRLDTILDAAEEKGIALQLVLVWYQGWTTYAGSPIPIPDTPRRPDMSADWFANPYNIQRGGPFGSATQFFASPDGQTAFKERLRYIVSRWSSYTSVFAWELVDQLDKLGSSTAETFTTWLKTMTDYLRGIDPFKHPITAGVRDLTRVAQLEAANLDFTEVRYYQQRPAEPAPDQVQGLLSLVSPLAAQGNRPVLINEFSLNPWYEPQVDDPTGVHIRSTLWASVFSGAAGTGAPNYWDTYLLPNKFDAMFAPLASFLRGMPWSRLKPIDVSLVSTEPIKYEPLRISGYNSAFGSITPDLTFRVAPDVVIPPISSASAYLYGILYNVQNSRPQKYIITPPIDTRLTINVAKSSDRAGARLQVIVDNKLSAEIALGKNTSPVSFSVPLTAGEHTVLIDNVGDDYAILDSLVLDDYIAPLRTLALADRSKGFFAALVQHRGYTWQSVAANTPISSVMAGLRISDMPAGLYRVELWDTVSGNVVGQDDVMVSGSSTGTLAIDLLPLTGLLAVKAVRIAEPGNLPTPTPTLSPTPRLSPTPTLERTSTPTNTVG